MPRSVLRIGTRGSMLALAQAEEVRARITQIITKRNFELVPVVTDGDRLPGEIPPLGGKGLFTDEIRDQLADGKIDLAVHSAKDLPAASVDGVVLASITKREDPRDALVTRAGTGLASLAPGSTVGTSALRRHVQLSALGRGLVPTPIRGNVDTRLRKMSQGEVQALVVALAGLRRLGRASLASEILSVDVMLPAPGQGALAVECRANDRDMRAALGEMEDPDTRRAFDAERSFLLALGGDCNLPLGALAVCDGERVRIRGLVGTPDGKRVLTEQIEGDDPEKTGLTLAERMRQAGADEIVAAIKRQ